LSRFVESGPAKTAEAKIDETRQNESAKRERMLDGRWRASPIRDGEVMPAGIKRDGRRASRRRSFRQR
jgi:hypothetical protein